MRGWLLLILLLATTAHAAGGNYIALSYHDVRDDVLDDLDPDTVAVSTDRLVDHFEWLRANGYRVVSLSRILDAARGGPTLPDKAVLLTFDDGLQSLYTRVYPLLRLYDYPAVAAVVTSWLDQGPDWELKYGGQRLTRSDFVSWRELREMADSGLVELAVHSHDLHRGVPSNPQGNTQPAAVTLAYDAASGRYESEEHYRRRVGADLARAAERIREATGHSPRAVVWPYGRFGLISEALAEQAGLPVSIGLESDVQPTARLQGIHRYLVGDNLSAESLARVLRHLGRRPLLGPTRALRIPMNSFYHPEAREREKRLGELVSFVYHLGITTVYLQAYQAAPDGSVTAVYFPTRQLPVRADLFNRVAWQLQTRAEVDVFAWLPVRGYPRAGGSSHCGERVDALFRDLAAHSQFRGLLISGGGHASGDCSLGPGESGWATRLRSAVDGFRPETQLARLRVWEPGAGPPRADWLPSGFDTLVLSVDGTREAAEVNRLELRPTARAGPGTPALVMELRYPQGGGCGGSQLMSRAAGLLEQHRHLGLFCPHVLPGPETLERIRPALSAASYPHRRP